MAKKDLHVVGIMSGTSLDGVDFVLCQVQQKPFKMTFLDQAFSKYPLSLHKKLLKATSHNLFIDQLAELDFELGKFYADQLFKHQHQRKWKIHLIGSHGQTVYHRGGHATLQIGKPCFLAMRLKIPVISDFRSMHIACGGEGAPLAIHFHQKVLAKIAFQWLSSKSKTHHTKKKMEDTHIAIQNIGGIANVTSILKKSIISYDVGPGNTLIDSFIHKITRGSSHYDKDGQLAFQGITNHLIIKKWMTSSWILKKPPKSFDRKEFDDFFKQCLKDLKGHSRADQAATLTDFTAELIKHSYKLYLPCLPEVVVLCGGGALNGYLLHRIKYVLSDLAKEHTPYVITSDDLGWPIKTVEGGAFALLATLCYWQKPVPVATNISKNQKAILGQITYPP